MFVHCGPYVGDPGHNEAATFIMVKYKSDQRDLLLPYTSAGPHKPAIKHPLLALMNSADRVGSPIHALANESTHSDASAFSYSPPVSDSTRFCLQDGHPSVITTIELFRRASRLGDATAMRSLAQVFSNCLSSAIAALDSLPEQVRTFPDYELARYGVSFTNQLLYSRSKSFKDSDANIVKEMTEMAFSNFSYFLEVAGHVYAAHKASSIPPHDRNDDFRTSSYDKPTVLSTHLPLPGGSMPEAKDNHPSPHDGFMALDKAENLARRSSESLAKTPDSVTSELPTLSSETSTLVETTFISDVSCTDPQSKGSQSEPGIIQRALRIRPSSASFLSGVQNRSTLTLVGSITGSEGSGNDLKKQGIDEYMRRHKALPDIPYDLRQSAVYFLSDPLHPEVDVDMPRLDGETVEVRLPPQGEYKAASLTALIRLVTSKDIITNPRTAQLFFFGLGYFISPNEAIAKLAERFHEVPPSALNTAQLRVWTREALTTRIRIAHFVALWLEQYWDSQVCNASTITTLQQFVVDDLLGSVPDSLSGKIVLLLDDVVNGRVDRKIWRAKLIERLSQGIKPPEPTRFRALLQKSDITTRLLQFDTPMGREELARHLTTILFDMHSYVDPVSAVKCWFHGDGESEAYLALQRIVHWERSFYFWVSSEVLAGESKMERRCLSLQNFSCASIIHGALNSPPIYRLKETLLAVDFEHKALFAILGDHFSGFNNYGKYRQTIDELKVRVQSYIPILAPLIRDIEVIKTAKPVICLSPDNPQSKVLNLAAAGVVQYTVNVLENGRLPYNFECTPSIIDWLGKQMSQYAPENEQAITTRLDELSTTQEGKRIGFEQVNGWLYILVDGSLVDLDGIKATGKKPSFFSRLLKKT